MLNKICRELGRPAMTVEDEAMAFLADYDWPGNCRELQNVVKTAAVLTSGNHIKLESLRAFFNPVISSGSFGNTLQEIEEQVITNRFRSFGGNISKAADSLKISRATLYRKLKDYNVTLDEI
jgi:two-component system response regulator HydG